MSNLLKDNKELMKKYNYEKNKNIDLETITLGSNTKIWWKCPKCRYEWQSIVKSKSNKKNCPLCSNRVVIYGKNDLYTYCLNNNRQDLIDEFDDKKNECSMKEISVVCKSDIWWKCKKCNHSWKASPARRISRNSGCGVCKHIILKKGVNDLQTTNPEIAKEWDYTKNKINPDEVMAGSNKEKYWFICPKGHSYDSTPLDRKKGNGCPQCAKEKHTSFPEKSIYYYLKKYLADVEENYHNSFLGRQEIDIFIPKLRVGIEYDGVAWHKNYKRDLKKDNVCSKNGIKLIRVRENGCNKYESDSVKIFVEPYKMLELNNAIVEIFNYLDEHYNIHKDIDIDVEKDRIKILEIMNLYEKENSLANYCPEIKKYWDKEKNGIIIPEQISHSSEKTIFLKCPKCKNEWPMLAKDFKLRPRCPYCYGRKVKTGYNDLFSTNPELIPLWSKNNTLNPRKLSKGCNFPALWYCPTCNGEYDMKINDKVRNEYGCPFCSGHRVLKGYNDLESSYPELLSDWDYEKNKIKPDEITKGSNETAFWKCHVCSHEWPAKISNRTLLNRGCPKCGKMKQAASQSKTVLQYSLDGKLITKYKSVSEAMRKTGISKISNVCRGERNQAGGYIWKYKDQQ